MTTTPCCKCQARTHPLLPLLHAAACAQLLAHVRCHLHKALGVARNTKGGTNDKRHKTTNDKSTENVNKMTKTLFTGYGWCAIVSVGHSAIDALHAVQPQQQFITGNAGRLHWEQKLSACAAESCIDYQTTERRLGTYLSRYLLVLKQADICSLTTQRTALTLEVRAGRKWVASALAVTALTRSRVVSCSH